MTRLLAATATASLTAADGQPNRSISGELDRHNFTSGGTFILGSP